MDYRSILKNQLEQRKLLNPRFSLRSLALKIELSPSKLSEIMRGLKTLSVKRASSIADKLGLSDQEREIFILSSIAESEKSLDSKTKLKKLISELSGQKTSQKNAWYFGAVKAMEDEGLDPKELTQDLGLTDLQIENAQRFLKRIKRYHPERKNISFEPTSLLSRLQDALLSRAHNQSVEFLFLDDETAIKLEREVQSLINKYRIQSGKNKDRHLRWMQFTHFRLLKQR